MITLHLDLTPRLTYPDRRVDAVHGCVVIERGPPGRPGHARLDAPRGRLRADTVQVLEGELVQVLVR